MADKADGIRQEIKKGRQDIAATRSALTDKLATLEQRVQEIVDGVKHTFDLPYQVRQRTWLMFSGSLLVGYMLGSRRNVSSPTADTSDSSAPSHPGMVADVRKHIESEIATMKAAAFGAVISKLWAMAITALLPARQIDGATPKPGDQPVDIANRVIASQKNGWHEL